MHLILNLKTREERRSAVWTNLEVLVTISSTSRLTSFLLLLIKNAEKLYSGSLINISFVAVGISEIIDSFWSWTCCYSGWVNGERTQGVSAFGIVTLRQTSKSEWGERSTEDTCITSAILWSEGCTDTTSAPQQWREMIFFSSSSSTECFVHLQIKKNKKKNKEKIPFTTILENKWWLSI